MSKADIIKVTWSTRSTESTSLKAAQQIAQYFSGGSRAAGGHAIQTTIFQDVGMEAQGAFDESIRNCDIFVAIVSTSFFDTSEFCEKELKVALNKGASFPIVFYSENSIDDLDKYSEKWAAENRTVWQEYRTHIYTERTFFTIEPHEHDQYYVIPNQKRLGQHLENWIFDHVESLRPSRRPSSEETLPTDSGLTPKAGAWIEAVEAKCNTIGSTMDVPDWIASLPDPSSMSPRDVVLMVDLLIDRLERDPGSAETWIRGLLTSSAT
jgi:hypothetical protein